MTDVNVQQILTEQNDEIEIEIENEIEPYEHIKERKVVIQP
ncbi:DUF262 domain-containing protein, partial [Salmonella enterica subsp. enterica serovar Dublin]|nr:DUF262 domain-containing protein [Salmonella enterica subsp. enterica serovar Dublin]